MKRPEQEIHKAVVAHLNARSEPRVFFWHTPNEGKRGWVNAAALKAMGMTAGVPDLLILKAGQLHALELKAPGGRLTPSQRLILERMESCGAQTAVAHSIDEALVTLEFWGILKRSVQLRSASSETPLQGQSNERPQRTTEGAGRADRERQRGYQGPY
ncbi:VRR-NUC domain-containing protein [Bradyrhizobium sp. AZCC 1578]|uniref:VRR-NUC domain-containing protein n=1 Tax=Bradyrhizobium sp. AZCC 1578 TaxID=3117027 RepID=UPI003FA5621E